jgi:hypothetical protein
MYRPGTTTQAYYNPRNPAKAFLIRHWAFFPYGMVLGAMLFLGGGLMMALLSGISRPEPPRPVEDTPGWYELTPSSTISFKERATFMISLLWFAVGILGMGHYFLCAERPNVLGAYVIGSLYAAAGCAPVGFFLYYVLLGRSVADARLCVNAQRFRLGDSVGLGVVQSFHKQRFLQEARIGLVAEKTTQKKVGGKANYVTTTCYETWITAAENEDVSSIEPLTMSWKVTIPEDQEPTTPQRTKTYPRYRWCFEVRLRLARCPDYRVRFPLVVRGAPAERPSRMDEAASAKV